MTAPNFILQEGRYIHYTLVLRVSWSSSIFLDDIPPAVGYGSRPAQAPQGFLYPRQHEYHETALVTAKFYSSY